MRDGIFITGTDTGVGKSAVAAGIAGALKKKGIDVGVMKPVQSGAPQTKDGLISQDACLMATAAGVDDKMDLINPICLREPLAPSVAAEAEGIKVDLKRIKKAYDRLTKMHDFIVVEGAGGIVVPITSDFLVVDLIEMLIFR